MSRKTKKVSVKTKYVRAVGTGGGTGARAAPIFGATSSCAPPIFSADLGTY